MGTGTGGRSARPAVGDVDFHRRNALSDVLQEDVGQVGACTRRCQFARRCGHFDDDRDSAAGNFAFTTRDVGSHRAGRLQTGQNDWPGRFVRRETTIVIEFGSSGTGVEGSTRGPLLERSRVKRQRFDRSHTDRQIAPVLSTDLDTYSTTTDNSESPDRSRIVNTVPCDPLFPS